ncbi:hypothetical protein BSAF29S_03650 [Bacillus safensis subsp. safensis]
MRSFPSKEERHQLFGSVPPSLGTKPCRKRGHDGHSKNRAKLLFSS